MDSARYPTAAQLNMTQQEAMAIMLGQREELVSLKAQLMIVTKCVEDLGRHCVDQQAQIVSMTENMVTMQKSITKIEEDLSEKEHPLRYVLGALRNDLSSTASSVQYLTDKLNKSNEDFTQLAMAFVRFQGKVGAELPATVEHPRYRKRTSAVNEAFTSNMEQPPMLVPVPTVPMLAAEVEELE